MKQDCIPEHARRVEQALDELLPTEDGPASRLSKAMRYAALAPGKRMRPRLVYATAEVLDIPPDRMDAAAAAVECIHAYSLIHDDLPAMDDDELRRGRPTTHIAFDEATAILAGDALQTQAFDILATHTGLDGWPAVRAAQLATLAHAAGAHGIVGGQILDIAAEGRDDVTVEDLRHIHELKTGALLAACVIMAANAAPGLSSEQDDALRVFSSRIGLAFQVRDDVLDIESSTEQLGKTQGADIEHEKATYPALLGLQEAKALEERLYDEAIQALSVFSNAEPLRALAAEIVHRDY